MKYISNLNLVNFRSYAKFTFLIVLFSLSDKHSIAFLMSVDHALCKDRKLNRPKRRISIHIRKRIKSDGFLNKLTKFTLSEKIILSTSSAFSGNSLKTQPNKAKIQFATRKPCLFLKSTIKYKTSISKRY